MPSLEDAYRLIDNTGNFFALMIWKGRGSDVIFCEMATFSRKPFQQEMMSLNIPWRHYPKWHLSTNRHSRWRFFFSTNIARWWCHGHQMLRTWAYAIAKTIKNQVINQHLPRGAVWIQGMVYGHPFSSIQHPLEDPGMLTGLLYVLFQDSWVLPDSWPMITEIPLGQWWQFRDLALLGEHGP